MSIKIMLTKEQLEDIEATRAALIKLASIELVRIMNEAVSQYVKELDKPQRDEPVIGFLNDTTQNKSKKRRHS